MPLLFEDGEENTPLMLLSATSAQESRRSTHRSYVIEREYSRGPTETGCLEVCRPAKRWLYLFQAVGGSTLGAGTASKCTPPRIIVKIIVSESISMTTGEQNLWYGRENHVDTTQKGEMGRFRGEMN